MKKPEPVIALIVPCFNEEACLPNTGSVLESLLSRLISDKEISPASYILYVDDGSTDATWDYIRSQARVNPSVRGISLAANSGHQNALIAGLEEAVHDADALISIDADLQDDVTVIPEMIRKYRLEADIVLGVRSDRSSDSIFKRATAQGFYNLQKKLGVKSIYNHADFRLMSRRATEAFLQYGERNMFIRGIIANLGFRQCTVEYSRNIREAGESKYPLRKMMNFAIDGITSFSVRPVRLIFFVGICFLLVASAIFIYSLIRYHSGHTIEGWTSTILSIWFCSGILLLSLGVMGEYIGKIYTEVKHRPRYHIGKRTPVIGKKQTSNPKEND